MISHETGRGFLASYTKKNFSTLKRNFFFQIKQIFSVFKKIIFEFK